MSAIKINLWCGKKYLKRKAQLPLSKQLKVITHQTCHRTFRSNDNNFLLHFQHPLTN